MGFAAQYTINNAAAAPQTWNRVAVAPGYAKYVNDTARASSIEEIFELRSTENISKKSSPTVTTLQGKWAFRFSSKILASEAEPVIFTAALTMTNSLAAALTTARSRYKDARLVYVALTDTDGEIDDATGMRTQ